MFTSSRFLSALLGLWLLLGLSPVQAGPLSAESALMGDGFERLAAPARHVGGSNYHWFGDDLRCRQESREAYNLLARYHEHDPELGPVRTLVRAQLAAMYQRGMRRLSLGLFFVHGFSGGSLIDAADPAQVAQVASNLALVLADVEAAGFEEVLFRFFPVHNMNPSGEFFPRCCDAQFDAHVDHYWNLIGQLRPVLAASRLPYLIDLMVEGAPRDSNPLWLPERERHKYPANRTWSMAVRRLWQRYHAAWGSADTVGFSFLSDDDANRMRARVRHMRYVYEGRYPDVFAMDFYAGPQRDEYQKFISMDRFMRSENPAGTAWDRASWIIAEAFYEDPLAAEGLSRAIRESGRDVLYLTQWPLDRASACDIEHVNTPPPYDWTVWGGYGF